MNYHFQLTARVWEDLEKLDATVRARIINKLEFFAQQPNPLLYAKRLYNFDGAEYRFRIGDYRVLFDVDNKRNITILIILAVRHRREVYD